MSEADDKRDLLIEQMNAMSDEEVLGICTAAPFVTTELLLPGKNVNGLARAMLDLEVPLEIGVLMALEPNKCSLAYNYAISHSRGRLDINPDDHRAVYTQRQRGGGSHQGTLAHALLYHGYWGGHAEFLLDEEILKTVEYGLGWAVAHEAAWQITPTKEIWSKYYSKWSKEILSLLTGDKNTSVAGLLASKGAMFTDKEIIKLPGPNRDTASVAHAMAGNGYSFVDPEILMFAGTYNSSRRHSRCLTVAGEMLVNGGTVLDRDEYADIYKEHAQWNGERMVTRYGDRTYANLVGDSSGLMKFAVSGGKVIPIAEYHKMLKLRDEEASDE